MVNNRERVYILQKIRVRGLGEVPQTEWKPITPKLTIFTSPSSYNMHGLLQALETINPSYDCSLHQPFKHYPLITRQGDYQKRVRPHKRTVALAVFAAQPASAKALGKITPHLYGADRIEVGRKLDYSQWVNFVEIASSTRWSEMQARFKTFLLLAESSLSDEERTLIKRLRPTDRIKGEIANSLSNIVNNLIMHRKIDYSTGELNNLQSQINRAYDFIRAKDYVKKTLPVFHFITGNIFSATTTELLSIEKNHKAEADVLTIHGDTCIETSLKTSGDQPIFLFEERSLLAAGFTKAQLIDYVVSLSERYQCIYGTTSPDDVGGKHCVVEFSGHSLSQ